MTAVLFAWAHHLAAFALVTSLVIELVLLKQEISVQTAKRILRADLIYGISAVFLISFGLARVFFFEKTPEYYFGSWVFWAKMLLFLLVGLLSALPTIEFLSWRKSILAGIPPQIEDSKMKKLRKIIHWELVLLPLILLAAAAMVKGLS